MALNAVLAEKQDFFPTPPVDEGIARLEPHHPLAFERAGKGCAHTTPARLHSSPVPH
jgi:hypothetical protein